MADNTDSPLTTLSLTDQAKFRRLEQDEQDYLWNTYLSPSIFEVDIDKKNKLLAGFEKDLKILARP